MSLADANTYILPSQGTSISVSRSQFNSSLRALLQNFYSPVAPTAVNLQALGSALSASEYNGMFYRDSNTGMLYVYDSSITSGSGRTNNPVGGNFTRYGIAWRQQGSLAAAAANIAMFDVGEAFVVVRDTGGASNNRMYYRVATTGTFSSDFVDVGTLYPGSVTATDISDGSITGAKLATTLNVSGAVILTPRLTSNTINNTQHTPDTAAFVATRNNQSTGNVAVGFVTAGNSSIVKQQASNAGLSVESTNGELAPFRSNVFLQTVVQGNTTVITAPLIPAGFIGMWPAASAPAGWLLLNGSSANTTTYNALFQQVGYTWGGSAGTFTLANAQGKSVYGVSAALTLGSNSGALGASYTSVSAFTSSSGGPTTHTTSNNLIADDTSKDVTACSYAIATVADHVAHTHTTSVLYPGIAFNFIIKT